MPIRRTNLRKAASAAEKDSPAGSDANTGESWAQALATISAAVTRAGTGGTILVSNGVYGVGAEIVVTNAIVLIDLVNQYRAHGQSVRDAVFNGARQRLRPILMTALATIFALVPMALGVTGSSGFISQDLAIVVIGGLISSTVLTLILVPVLYLLFEGGRERRGAASRARAEAAAESVDA